MIKILHKGNKDVSLLSRCKTICNFENKSLQIYIFDDKYENQCTVKLKTVQRSGVVDPINKHLVKCTCPI